MNMCPKMVDFYKHAVLITSEACLLVQSMATSSLSLYSIYIYLEEKEEEDSETSSLSGQTSTEGAKIISQFEIESDSYISRMFWSRRVAVNVQ